MKLEYNRKNIINGGILFPLGDSIAALILGEFSWLRMLGIALVGATVYAFEIPNYFAWIDRIVKNKKSFVNYTLRTILATAYFNPLWIARHMFFISLFSLKFNELTWKVLISTGTMSFIGSLPLALGGNFIILNLVKPKWRFFTSSVFSGIMAIYYALSITYFE